MQGVIKRIDWQQTMQNYGLLTAGSVALAVSFNIFMAPHNTAPGGLTGITLILGRFLPVPKGVILLILQMGLLLFGMRHLGGKAFMARSLYSSVLYSLGIELLAPLLPAGGITNDMLLNTVYGGLLGGVGVGLIFRGNGSLAGTSIISRILQLRTGMGNGILFLMVDGGIIFLLGLFLGWDKALYALIMLFIWGTAVDYVLEGPSKVHTIFIVTNRPETVSHHLQTRAAVSVTAWQATGMYSHHAKTTLFCTVRRTEINDVTSTVKESDPQAFWVIGQGHQAKGF